MKVSDAAILDAISRLKAASGVAPTYRELAAELGLASWSSARYRVLQLEVGGSIERRDRVARSVQLKGGNHGQA
jgi:SOS-response transcriptional repressor LexA